MAKRLEAEKVTFSGGELIMRNMRELLWYWQEYYLRRGRDRLSVEFSVHIPFRYWMELVGNTFYILLEIDFLTF